MANAATASTVILMRPPDPVPVTAEAIVRIHGELVSAGFDVQVAAAVGGPDARAALESTAAGQNVDAVLGILGDSLPDSVEIWVVDRVTGKSVVKRLPFRPEQARAAEILSIKAIELLRASFLEVGITSSRLPPPKPPPVVVTRFVAEALATSRELHWGIEIGGSLGASLDGVGPAVTPMIRLDWAPVPWCIVRTTAAGLGTQARVNTPSGLARVTEQFGLLEAGLRFRSRMSLRPFISLGAGALRTSAEGDVAWPYEGRTAAAWSFLMDAGVGLRASLRSRFEIGIEGHAQLAQPYPIIRFIDSDVATSRRPGWLLNLTMTAWL
jgi:hypothetical protein